MDPPPYPAELVLGPPKSPWTYDPSAGYNLARAPTHGRDPPPCLWMKTATQPVILNPIKTALLIIDVQNLFLSRALGHHQGPLHAAEETLREVAIPAARRAGIQVVHLTWGFSAAEARAAPPAVLRRFSPFFEGRVGAGCRRSTCSRVSAHQHGAPAVHTTVGDDMGPVTLYDGRVTPAGRKLIRGTWNADLYESMRRDVIASVDTPLPDARFYKTRANGFFADGGGVPDVVRFLKSIGVTTLLIGGVGTEEGVWASARGAGDWGFDVVLLADGCGTLAGSDVSRTVEESCALDLGFLSTCVDFSRGVASMLKGM